MNYVEIAILGLQFCLIAGQLYLSWRMNQQDLKRKKGYFLPKETNIPVASKNPGMYRDQYNLNYHLPFFVAGNDDVFLLRRTIVYNGKHLDSNETDQATYYSRDDRFRTFFLRIDPSFLASKDELSVMLYLTLKNTSDYEYRQEVEMVFKNEAEETWRMVKFNTVFK